MLMMRKLYNSFYFFLVVYLFIFFVSCLQKPERGNTIVTTTAAIADMVLNVTGGGVPVEYLIGPGLDPHTYIPTRQDTQRITEARIVLYNGLHLEGALYNVLRSNEKKEPYYAISDFLSAKDLLYIDATVPDPHIWMDISLWSKIVEPLSMLLAEYYPTYSQVLAQGADTATNAMQELHQWALTQLEVIPQNKRILITSHDAFNYFGRAYQFEVLGVQGISTITEASLNEINSLVDLLVKRDIQAIFIESSVSPKNIKALIEGAGALSHSVIIGGSLFSDSLGIKGTKEATYAGMIRHNIATIVTGLSTTE